MNRAAETYVWMNIAGLAASLLITFRYPLLDLNAILFAALTVFFIPLLLQIILTLAKQAATRFDLLRETYKWAGIASIVIAILLFSNGALDKAPSVEAHVFVTQKSVSRGRGGPTYYLTVSPSWRDGRTEERLRVRGAIFASVRTGEPVTIETHRGALGLPWFDHVAAD